MPEIPGPSAEQEVEHLAGQCAELLAENERLRAALSETTAEAIEHRDDMIKAMAHDFQGINDPKYQQTYDREIARLDALVQRARAALKITN